MPDTPDLIRLYVSQSPEAILLVDASGIVVFQNLAARLQLGFDDDEILGRQAADVLHGKVIDGSLCDEEASQILSQLYSGELKRDHEVFITQKGGEVILHQLTFVPLLSQSGNLGTAIRVAVMEHGSYVEVRAGQEEPFVKIATKLGSIGLFSHNVVTGEMIWNDILRAQLGIPEDAEISIDLWLSRIHPLDLERMKEIYESTWDPAKNKGRIDSEYRVCAGSGGAVRWLAASGRIFYHDGRPVRLIGATVDITQRKELEERLREAATHDPLTGLPNRRLLSNSAAHIFEASRMLAKRCAVMFLDINRFRLVNDLYGHDVGDEILKKVAYGLRACVNEGVIVCRLGGDEFILLVPDVHDIPDAERTARSILDELKHPVRTGTNEVPLSASIGISLFPDHGADLKALIKCADLAMYAAKQAGRSAYALYTENDGRRAEQQLQVELQLQQAIDEGALKVLYQPIVRVDDGRVIGAEALVRATGNDGNLLLPDIFIPIAEKTGQIKQIGLWVMHEVCRQIDLWQQDGWGVGPIAVNVSAHQLSQEAFVDEFLDVLKKYGIASSQIHVELTESAIMNNLADAIEVLNKLRLAGLKISLDDFGTGYSSLSLLSNLPLDKLKIDQSFIRRLQTDNASQAVADAIFALGRSLNLQVLAEGVESAQAMRYLRDQGCSQAQGFLFSKPMPAAEFKLWCEERARCVH